MVTLTEDDLGEDLPHEYYSVRTIARMYSEICQPGLFIVYGPYQSDKTTSL